MTQRCGVLGELRYHCAKFLLQGRFVRLQECDRSLQRLIQLFGAATVQRMLLVPQSPFDLIELQGERIAHRLGLFELVPTSAAGVCPGLFLLLEGSQRLSESLQGVGHLLDVLVARLQRQQARQCLGHHSVPF